MLNNFIHFFLAGKMKFQFIQKRMSMIHKFFFILIIHVFVIINDFRKSGLKWKEKTCTFFYLKGNSISESRLNLDLNVFLAKIWKLFSLNLSCHKKVFRYYIGISGLNSFEFKRNHFDNVGYIHQSQDFLSALKLIFLYLFGQKKQQQKLIYIMFFLLK